MTAHTGMPEKHPLAHILAQWPDLQCDTGPLHAGWTDLHDLDAMPGAELEAILALQALTSPGLDRRGQAAFVFGALAYNMASLYAVLHLTGAPMPTGGRGEIGVRLNRQQENETAPLLQLRLAEDAPLKTMPEAERRVRVPQFLQQYHASIARRLLADTRLSAAAQWRLLADSLAGAMLYIGRQMEIEGRARSDALAMLTPGRSALSNRQTGFLQVQISKQNGSYCETFLSRGGCCRYYTADEGEYCATCVLRKPGDRHQQLKAHLHEVHAT